MKTECVCLGGSSSHVWIKGTGSESLTDSLALPGILVCRVVTKVISTLNKGIFFSIKKKINQRFLSFGGIFHECKHTKIRLFSVLPNFSASLKFQINVVSVIILDSV